LGGAAVDGKAVVSLAGNRSLIGVWTQTGNTVTEKYVDVYGAPIGVADTSAFVAAGGNYSKAIPVIAGTPRGDESQTILARDLFSTIYTEGSIGPGQSAPKVGEVVELFTPSAGTHAGTPGGNGVRFHSGGIPAFVEFTIPELKAGTYDFSIGGYLGGFVTFSTTITAPGVTFAPNTINYGVEITTPYQFKQIAQGPVVVEADVTDVKVRFSRGSSGAFFVYDFVFTDVTPADTTPATTWNTAGRRRSLRMRAARTSRSAARRSSTT